MAQEKPEEYIEACISSKADFGQVSRRLRQNFYAAPHQPHLANFHRKHRNVATNTQLVDIEQGAFIKDS